MLECFDKLDVVPKLKISNDQCQSREDIKAYTGKPSAVHGQLQLSVAAHITRVLDLTADPTQHKVTMKYKSA